MSEVLLTATEDSGWPPRILVAATGMTVGATVTISRIVSGQPTPLRGADGIVLGDTSLVRRDGEQPFGIPFSYLLESDLDTTMQLLTVDGGFETAGVPGWTATAATFAQSTDQHLGGGGTHSGKLVVVGSPTKAYARASAPILAGTTTVYMVAWLYSTVLTTHAEITIDWYDASSVLLSTSKTSVASLAANTWTEEFLTAAVPAGAVTATYGPTLASSPSTGAVLYIDALTLDCSPIVSGPVTSTLPGGKVALSDAITGLAVETVITAWPQRSNQRNGTKFIVGGRTAAVNMPRGDATQDVEFLTEYESSRQQMIALLNGATDGIILIRQPGGYYGVDGHYYVDADVERRTAQNGRLERRLFTLTLIDNPGWDTSLLASGSTYADVEAAYTGLTYADLAADFATYLEIAVFDWDTV